MTENNLVITITNNTDKKIYTSFLAPGDSGKVSQRITTDSSTSLWQPPVLKAATNCSCTDGLYTCVSSQTQLTIPIKIDDMMEKIKTGSKTVFLIECLAKINSSADFSDTTINEKYTKTKKAGR